MEQVFPPTTYIREVKNSQIKDTQDKDVNDFWTVRNGSKLTAEQPET